MFATKREIIAGCQARTVGIHRHGSGIYRGQYLALRQNSQNRKILMSGKKDAFFDKLKQWGITACPIHNKLNDCKKCDENTTRIEKTL